MKNIAIFGLIALAIANLGRMEPDAGAPVPAGRAEVRAAVSDGGHDSCDGCDTAFAGVELSGGGCDSNGGHDGCDGHGAFAGADGGHDSCDGCDNAFDTAAFTEADGGHDSCDGCDNAFDAKAFANEAD